ncbi:RNA polymerase sigma-54 factor RpoN [hydrothermal vent metagenome]|uniref:RNA polymerase sigma-54 factor RpoN n=1 Tax=hydrothermal vent metagenome TaxID=652676 RepID=A0A3B0TDW2_9ZZZZ
MALTPRLEIRQSQSLTLTPQLMLSIKLLQFSHLELDAFVEKELERNPLLERVEENQDGAVSSIEENANNYTGNDMRATQDALLEAPARQLDAGALPSASQIAQSMDTEVSNLFPEQVGQDSVGQSTHLRSESPMSSGAMFRDGDAPDIDQYVPALITLGEHLSKQVGFLITDPGERLIARNLINNLDEAGYLATDCASIATQLGSSSELVEQVLLRIQGCEPVGVFARDLGECLMLQLREKNRMDPLMEKLLENLDLLAAHDFDALKRVVGASSDDLSEMLDEIRQLDPRPGRAFGGAPVQPVIADVLVRKGHDGGWALELNSEVLPRVLVNRSYFSFVSKHARNKKEKAFLVDCLQNANWLTKSLDQRAQTILKTATEIVRQQDGFFVHGVSSLKPMTLKMVADAIQMHESTISRVTSNKYMATPRGLFEMKYFFTTALGSTSGQEDHSAESVRYLIKLMIDEESPGAILSDDAIARILRQRHAIDVARRTVAKYREGLHIPSSVIRRRQKRTMAKTD